MSPYFKKPPICSGPIKSLFQPGGASSLTAKSAVNGEAIHVPVASFHIAPVSWPPPTGSNSYSSTQNEPSATSCHPSTNKTDFTRSISILRLTDVHTSRTTIYVIRVTRNRQRSARNRHHLPL